LCGFSNRSPISIVKTATNAWTEGLNTWASYLCIFYFEHFAFTTLHLACVVMQRDRYFEHFAFTTLHLACVVMQGRMELPFRPPRFYVSAQLARLLARAYFIRFT
jgi:hypothetical protein